MIKSEALCIVVKIKVPQMSVNAKSAHDPTREASMASPRGVRIPSVASVTLRHQRACQSRAPCAAI